MQYLGKTLQSTRCVHDGHAYYFIPKSQFRESAAGLILRFLGFAPAAQGITRERPFSSVSRVKDENHISGAKDRPHRSSLHRAGTAFSRLICSLLRSLNACEVCASSNKKRAACACSCPRPSSNCGVEKTCYDFSIITPTFPSQRKMQKEPETAGFTATCALQEGLVDKNMFVPERFFPGCFRCQIVAAAKAQHRATCSQVCKYPGPSVGRDRPREPPSLRNRGEKPWRTTINADATARILQRSLQALEG
jgi:hypothetical protein